MDKIKSIKISIAFTHIFFWMLVGFTIALPKAVTWYVETMGREQSLPTTVMVTCYPCVPFAAATLICLRRVLRNVLKGELFHHSNIRYLSFISAFCLVIAVITIVGGRFYLPFYIVAATFSFLALLVFALKNAFAIEAEKNTLCNSNEPAEESEAE